MFPIHNYNNEPFLLDPIALHVAPPANAQQHAEAIVKSYYEIYSFFGYDPPAYDAQHGLVRRPPLLSPHTRNFAFEVISDAALSRYHLTRDEYLKRLPCWFFWTHGGIPVPTKHGEEEAPNIDRYPQFLIACLAAHNLFPQYDEYDETATVTFASMDYIRNIANPIIDTEHLYNFVSARFDILAKKGIIWDIDLSPPLDFPAFVLPNGTPVPIRAPQRTVP